MTTNAQEESAHRLNALKGRGEVDAARAAIEAGHPFFDHMEMEKDRALRALEMPPGRLESEGIAPVEVEAIVRAVVRPPMLVEGGRVSVVPLPPAFGPGIEDKIRASETSLASVGRFEFLNHGKPWGGTGWVLKDEGDGHLLVVTNRHVARNVAKRGHDGRGVFLRAPFTMVRYGAVIDFNEEHGALPTDARQAEIVEFTYLADDASADVAIGRIRKPESFEIAPLHLADDDGDPDETVAVIGFPAYDSRNDRTEMEEYFKGLYDVKRFAPGFLLPAPDGQVLSHDCTTLGGNSGSPILSLDRNRVVGLHFSGEYGVSNSAVRVSTLKALLDGERPPQVVIAAASFDEGDDGTHAPDHFEGRAGYDKNFLSGEVPFPGLPEGMFDLAVPSDSDPERPHELRYTHFGVLFDLARKSPVATAVNIDGEKVIPIKREKPDTWFFDARIDIDRQLARGDFPGALDRGHMVRRQDPNWGETRDIAQRANDDTFHYTNASPQHASLNRSVEAWLGLENHILESTETHGFRASVFTGPLFDLDGEDPFLDEIGAPLPLQYWKVVVMDAMRDDGTLRLHATAYLLSQGLAIQKFLQDRARNEAVEGFVFGEYRTFQVSIAFLEELSGFDWGADLRNADPLAERAEGLELPDGWMPFVELASEEDAVL